MSRSYFYPPPSLLLLRALEKTTPPGFRPADFWVAASVLAGLLCITSLVVGRGGAAGMTGSQIYVALLLVSSSPVVETVEIGQINLFVACLIGLFLWAWRRGRDFVAATFLAGAICLKITPLLFIALFLTPRRWKGAAATAACTALLVLATSLLVPVKGLMSSWWEAFRWGSAQEGGGSWNCSWSVVGPSMAEPLLGPKLGWRAVHLVKTAVLLLIMGATYVAYLRRGRSNPGMGAAFFATLSVCMLIAPHIVWLHHPTLIIPGLWVLLEESKDRSVFLMTLGAMLCFQVLRYYQGHWEGDCLPFVVGQVVLLGASILYALKAWSGSSKARPFFADHGPAVGP